MNLIGAILAGGKSQRMGQDKALLRIGSTTLLDLMQKKLATLPNLDEIIICGRDATQPNTETTDDHPPGNRETKYLLDSIPNLGPIGALYTLGIHYPGHRALIIPVDMPQLKPSALEELCVLHDNQNNALHYENHHFPLLINFNENTLYYLQKRALKITKDLSIARFLKDIQARQLTMPEDKSQFANLNTPEQWRSLATNI